MNSAKPWMHCVPDMPITLDGDGPLHEQIRKAFARKISARDLKPGDRLPFEHELVRSLNTSRMTVSRALQALAEDGLIVRRRKAGSFVAEQTAFETPVTIHVPRNQIEAAGKRYGYKRLSKAKMTPVSQGSANHVLHLVCLHTADEKPVLLEKRWINLDAVPAAADETFKGLPPGEWLLRNVPWNEAEHTISAIGADEETATCLQIKPGTACLKVDRRTWSGDASITHVSLIYPGDQMKLAGQYRPGQQALSAP